MSIPDQDPTPRLLKFQERLKSQYFSQEMLFEYFKNELTEPEAKVTEKYLLEFVPLRQDFEDMKLARQFMNQLRMVRLSEPMLARVETVQPMSLDLSRRLDLTQWPAGVKQSVMVIAGALGVLAILLLIPWVDIYHQITQNQTTQVVLVESPRLKNEVDLSTYEKQEKPEFSDEKEATADVAAAKPVPQPPDTQIATTLDVKVPPTPITPLDKSPPAPPPAKPVVSATTKAQEPTQNTAAATSGGFLYRGRVTISNLKDTEPKITEKIIELGGRKAGEVDLGWKKTPQSAYYHFTIPENKLNDLNQFLALYGEPKIVKEKHPRIMAEGIVRLIVEIEEAKK